MRGLAGKTILVTGAGSGIGAATTIRLVEEGARVVGADISAEGLAATGRTLSDEAFSPVEFDLGDARSIKALIGSAVDVLGRLDGVVNVAADVRAQTMDKDVDVSQLDVDLWRHVLDVNLVGTATVIRESLAHLSRQAGGSIVNISSATAWMGEPVRPAYAASKIALHSLTRHTASAWGKQGVRCNAIAPGLVLSETGMALMPADYKAAMLNKICCPRLGVAEDIAASAAFLLSDDASWINGQIWSVDGGLIFRE